MYFISNKHYKTTNRFTTNSQSSILNSQFFNSQLKLKFSILNSQLKFSTPYVDAKIVKKVES